MRLSDGFEQEFLNTLMHHIPLLRIIHAACGRVVISLILTIQNWGFKPKFVVTVPLYFRRLAPAAPRSPGATLVKMEGTYV